MAAVERSLQQSVRLFERHVLALNRLGGRTKLLGAALRVAEYASCVLRIRSSGTANTASA